MTFECELTKGSPWGDICLHIAEVDRQCVAVEQNAEDDEIFVFEFEIYRKHHNQDVYCENIQSDDMEAVLSESGLLIVNCKYTVHIITFQLTIPVIEYCFCFCRCACL